MIEVEEDCKVLLERTLLGKFLCAFGEDGCGLYGRKDTPSFFRVDGLHIDISVENSLMVGKLSIQLNGYDENDVGHIQTDKNFDISLNELLKSEGISPEALCWASIEDQVHGCVTFDLNITKLLGW